MEKVSVKEFPNLIGKRVKLISNGVVYEGRVAKVEPDFVQLDAGATSTPQLIRLDRRIMGKSDNHFLYVKE